MARNALQALNDLDLLGVDSLIFLSNEADPRAETGRGNGLGDAGDHADGSAFGLEIAATAPDGVPVDPDAPQSSGFGDIIAIDVISAGRGGTKGPNNGDDSDDTGGTSTITASFISGDEDLFLDGDKVEDNYNIQVDFYGDLWLIKDEAGAVIYDLGEAFVAAAEFLSSITAEGANDVYDQFQNLAYDDLIIDAKLTSFSDPNILGQAGPTGVRSSDGLTATGIMEFSIDYAATLVDNGTWDDVVLHEMMHVLGFGTLWDYNNLLQTTSVQTGGFDTRKPTDDTYETTIIYTGDAANAAYDDDNSTFLFVEQDGGSGTAGGHWNEIMLNDDGTAYLIDPLGYGNEIMTGFINETNYLSYFSIASLDDIGYTLDAGYALLVDGAQTTEDGIKLESGTGYEDLLLTA